MATEVSTVSSARNEAHELGRQWRSLGRAATIVALLTSPVAFAWWYVHEGLDFRYAFLLTVIEVAAFRGLIDVIFRRFIPWPSLFGAEESLREEDVVARKRVWFWRRWFSRLLWLVVIGIVVYGIGLLLEAWLGANWVESVFGPTPAAQFLPILLQMPLLFLANFAIFFGPFLLMK